MSLRFPKEHRFARLLNTGRYVTSYLSLTLGMDMPRLLHNPPWSLRRVNFHGMLPLLFKTHGACGRTSWFML